MRPIDSRQFRAVGEDIGAAGARSESCHTPFTAGKLNPERTQQSAVTALRARHDGYRVADNPMDDRPAAAASHPVRGP